MAEAESTPAPAPARAIRMPLQIGTSGLTALNRAALYLVPAFVCGVIAIIPLLYVMAELPDLGDTVGKIVFCIFIAPAIPFFWAVRRGWRALMHALEERPSDLVIDGDSLVILGGPHHNKRVKLASAGCSLTERKIDDGEVAASQLKLGGEEVAVAVRPAERKSLESVRDTIRALGAPHAKPAPDRALQILVCPKCDAPAIPVDAPTVVCAHCGAQITVPDEIRERARAVAIMALNGPRNERRLRSLLRQPSARAANLSMAIMGIPMLLVWPLIGFVGIVLYDGDKLTFTGFLTLVVGALAMVTALYFLARVWLVNRQGLAIVTTHFGAAPPTAPGKPPTCRVCNAELPNPVGTLFVQCQYCGSDNVLGLDVRGDAKLELAQTSSLADALQRRTSDRVTFGLLAVGAAALMLGDIQLLKPHLVPVGAWLRCSGDHPDCGTPLEALEASCSAGSAAACASVYSGAIDAKTLGDYGPTDATRALQNGCTKGVAVACTDLGKHMYSQDLIGRDPELGKTLLTRGCDLGDGGGCARLGEILEHRHDTDSEKAARRSLMPVRTAEAYALFDKGCKLGNPSACLDAGTYLRTGYGAVTADVPRAQAQEAAACKTAGPNTPACHRVACNGGDMKACTVLADDYINGDIDDDDELVMGLEKQACDANNGNGCALYGYQLEHNPAYTPDLPGARAMFKKGCDLNSDLGCNNLGYAWDHGIGGDKDLAEAVKWFSRACDLGYKQACDARDEDKAALTKSAR